MLGNILEISNRTVKGGRVPIKIALLKIHEVADETNKNGIHWKEEYVKNAIDSVKFMPICSSFIDEEKSIPLDHGLTGEYVNEDGIREPLFENSETVGCFESADIEDVTVNNSTIKALVANGFLYNQRYPNFVQWIRKNHAIGNVDTSIEIMGLESNDNKIVYEEETPTNEFRTPMQFLFSGSSILSVTPADSDAVVLEIAQKQNNKEDKTLDEKELKELIQSTISETNSKNDELMTQISELNSQLAEKDNTISELNASVEQLQATIAKMEADHRTYWEEREILEKELAKAKVAEKLAELDATLGEFNEKERECASEDIEKLKAQINACEKKDELNDVSSEINSIKSKICMDIVAKQKQAETESKIAEQNSLTHQKETEVVDIFSEICTEVQAEEEVNIF